MGSNKLYQLTENAPAGADGFPSDRVKVDEVATELVTLS